MLIQNILSHGLGSVEKFVLIVSASEVAGSHGFETSSETQDSETSSTHSNSESDSTTDSTTDSSLDSMDKLIQSELGTLEPHTSLVTSIVNSFIENATSTKLEHQAESLTADFNESLVTNSKITMLPNFNIEPTGKEHGNFLCIDLGGSTLRVAVVKIDPETTSKDNKSGQKSDQNSSDRSSRISVIIEENWSIDNSFKIIDLDFFRFIATKIQYTLASQILLDPSTLINTGITWSFPLETTSHNNGRIVHVSKGYTISPEIFGKDLKSILEGVLKTEFGISIDIKIIINDSLAVYSAGAFLDKFMKLALVLGTGLNMCCSLNASDKIHDDKIFVNSLHSSPKILFNTELSLFGDKLLPLVATKYDNIIDSRFLDFGFHFKCFMSADPITNKLLQPTELMTSGRYLPELTRLVLCDLISSNNIFSQVQDLSTILDHPFDGFNGEIMCFVNESDDLDAISKKICAQYNWDQSMITENDIVLLKYITDAIIKRGAFIVAVSIVSFIKLLTEHNNDNHDSKLTIGYVGSVLTYFNNYRNLVKEFINENEYVKKLGLEVDFKLVDNSSIIGAAIGAAYYS